MTQEAMTREEFEAAGAWGLMASVDLHGCNPFAIRDAITIREFVIELCEKIDMNRYGECRIVDFGEDPKVAGFSMTQLIETSLVSGHFVNLTNSAYIDVFSCKYFDPELVQRIAGDWFHGKSVLHVTLRK
jgi:S-adenosylmethionine/arginine decarboxylase-like enzyme